MTAHSFHLQYSNSALLACLACRVSIGDNSLLGDQRWGGLFGIDARFIAAEDVKVCNLQLSIYLDVDGYNLNSHLL